MPRTDRKRVRKTYKKRAKPKEKGEKKFHPKEREIGRMRTFLWSRVSESQGSHIVVSQQQASSAACNTHVVLSNGHPQAGHYSLPQ